MPPPTEPSADIPALFATERGLLLELLATLGTSDWERPSPCPGWTVLGLCTHLVGDDLGLLARHRDRHHGTPAPDGVTEAEFIAWLDELQIEWVRAARRLSPRLVVDLLGWTGPQIVETFRQQDPRERSAHVSWAGLDPVPVWLDQVRELSEYWIHRQQLLDAVDSPADLQPALLAPILDGLRWAFPFRLGPVPPAAPGDTVCIEITGPVSVTWYLAGADAGWAFRPEPAGPIVARLSMSTDEAWRLLTNNLPADRQQHLRLSGDERVVDIIRATRAIIGSPR